MNDDLFARLCAVLGHDPATVRVIRLSAGEAGVSWTEPSGMPRSTVYRLDRDPAAPGDATRRVPATA